MNLYDIAREVTDEVMGKGTYAKLNGGSPDPSVQAAIKDTNVSRKPSVEAPKTLKGKDEA